MALAHVIQAAHFSTDEQAADVLAILFNSDQATRVGLGGSPEFTGKDVLRLGKILACYADSPAPQTTLPKVAQLDIAIRAQAADAIATDLGITKEPTP